MLCVSAGNLVLGRASEHTGPDFLQERFIGMVLIPADQREQVEVQVRGELSTPCASAAAARPDARWTQFCTIRALWQHQR